MDQKILWAVNHMPKTEDKNLPIMGLEEIKKARAFHEKLPAVQPDSSYKTSKHGFLSGSKGSLCKR